jgi:hypothetical protein
VSNEVTVAFAYDQWDDPIDQTEQERAQLALESGQILYFPMLPFAVLPEERPLVARNWPDGQAKNLSFDAGSNEVKGAKLDAGEASGLRGLMARYAKDSRALVEGLIPGYRGQLRQARTSFRPADITDRALSPRKDDRRLHVDAFPSRPNHGERILRVFTNINPHGKARVWRVGEPFEDLAKKFLPRVSRPVPGLSLAYAALGITKGRRSLYDHRMLQLHDLAKLDDHYQATGIRAEIPFPAGSTWIAFTDQVLHAAIAGSHALEQTFHLPVAAQRYPERAPVRVLQRLAAH